jgi:hypothetical protein
MRERYFVKEINFISLLLSHLKNIKKNSTSAAQAVAEPVFYVIPAYAGIS